MFGFFSGPSDVKCEIADSLSGEPVKSILSEPIDEEAVSCTPDKFMETLEKDFRTAPDLGMIGGLLSSAELKETPTEDGQLLVVVDLTTPMFGAMKLASKVKVDHESGLATRQSYLDPDNVSDATLFETRCFKIHRSPFRVECWTEALEVRDSSSGLNGTIQWVLDGVMDLAGVAHVKVEHSVDSPSSPGLKSLVSAPMDGVITREKFWEIWEQYLREHKDMAPGLNSTLEITENGEGFSEVELDANGQKIRFRKHEKNLDANTWTIHRFKDEGMTSMYDTFEVRLHTSPALVVEFWCQKYAGRLADTAELLSYQMRINEIIKKAQPGWFS